MGDKTEPLLDGVPDSSGLESVRRDDEEVGDVDAHVDSAIDPVIRCTLDEGEVSQSATTRNATVRFFFATNLTCRAISCRCVCHVDSKTVAVLTPGSSVHVC